MRRTLNIEALSQREVPAALDRRILDRARLHCRIKNSRRQKKLLWIGSSAAAACIAVAAAVVWNGSIEEQRSQRRSELLAMSDFTKIDQTGYNMSFMLSSGQDVVQNEL